MSFIAKKTKVIILGLVFSLVPSATLAAEYGGGTYGSGTYDSDQACVQGESLTSTGYIIWPLLIVGVLLLLAAVYLIYKGHQKRNSVSTEPN